MRQSALSQLHHIWDQDDDDSEWRSDSAVKWSAVDHGAIVNIYVMIKIAPSASPVPRCRRLQSIRLAFYWFMTGTWISILAYWGRSIDQLDKYTLELELIKTLISSEWQMVGQHLQVYGQYSMWVAWTETVTATWMDNNWDIAMGEGEGNDRISDAVHVVDKHNNTPRTRLPPEYRGHRLTSIFVTPQRSYQSNHAFVLLYS